MAKTPTILVADHDGRLSEKIRLCMENRSWRVRQVHTGEDLVTTLGRDAFDVLLFDMDFPGMGALDALEFLQRSETGAPVILCMDRPNLETAVEVVRKGAFDVFDKSAEPDRLRTIVRRALERERDPGVEGDKAKPVKESDCTRIVGESEAMKKVLRMVERVAPTDSTVLILGESGTGKELIARAVHRLSPRAANRMVTINCGAIPQELLESELFGFEKGAFTGAYRSRPGRFELAHEGTIFLDEIGDMPMALQVKLLRVLQEKSFERIGGRQSVRVNVRVVAATHRDLETGIREKTFRDDLYYRLNVFPISLPPLRERRSDIPLLADAVLEGFRSTRGHGISGISEQALAVCMEYDWPGNVRELENAIERAIILKDEGRIEMEDLPENMCEAVLARRGRLGPDKGDFAGLFDEGSVNFSTAVGEFERRLILEALNRTDWVKNRAARLLNLKRTTLVEKMKRIRIQDAEPDR